jgi:tetratricopeptide (TPR) repeat protein
MIGISIADGGFELICAEPIGRRRYLDEETATALEDFGKRYAKLLESANPAEGLLALGRGLYRFLDGDSGDLTKLLDGAPRPIHFEIAAPTRRPDQSALALLRAPWELLANDQGFLAGDDRLGFSPVRRLGRPTALPPLDPHRLGLVFMAASPRGVVDLDYEAEETAIMTAVGSSDLDLLVEESGNPHELGDRIVEVPAMQALHLSCHGHNAWRVAGAADRRPVLMLEDEGGGELPTDAGALIAALRAKPPRLVFLSACLTAAGGGARRGVLAQSFAEALVDGGLPATLGWDGSVADRAAIAFAATLYDSLAGRSDLTDAVASARRSLLNAPDEALRGDWHLARLWLGPGGGGPLVGGSRRRDLVPNHGEKEFLVKQRRKVPVASHEMFVGRRHELQTVLRALREGTHAGILLHGMGRLGKSSLAARIANRRRDLKLAVVFEHYGALDIFAALEEALQENRDARELVRQSAQRVRKKPESLEDALIDLLCAPCMEVGDGGTPLLLIIDDLERILDLDPAGGPTRVKPESAPVMRAVLRAFNRTIDSRLILTSRHPFVLEGLEERLLPLQLPPLSEAAQRKLELRQKEAAAGAVLVGAEATEREKLLGRVPTIARGNPGLQDLIGRRLILSSAVTLEHAEQTLGEMEAWLEQGDLPSDAQVREFLEDLAIGTLINLAGEQGKALLRSLMLFDLPVPIAVASHVEALVGGELQHLRDLGLVDAVEDLVDHRQVAVAVNALAAGRLQVISEEERDNLVRSVAHPLFLAWGSAAGAKVRPLACDLQLTILGLAAGDGEIVGTCAPHAVLALDRGPASERSTLGRRAIELLDAQRRTVPLRLLSETANAASTSGDGQTADMLLSRAAALVAEQQAAGSVVDPMAAGSVFYGQASRFATRGDLDQAKQLFEKAAELAAAAGEEGSAARAHGEIAEILYWRGDLDEALRIRQEEELPVYDRLGDLHSRALAMGQIAAILFSRGDLDEALRIRREEQLPVFERMGDVRARAVTMGQIADILVSRGDLDEALRIRHQEQLPVYERLGDVRARAVTMGKIADILESRGDLDEALRIRQEEQLPVYERLGDARARAVTMGKIADILEGRGDLDEALRIFQEELLPVFDRLGEVRSRAVTMGKIADILESRGDLDEALRIFQEELLPVFERLGDVRERAVTMGKIADILVSRGDLEGARALRAESLDAFRRLGVAEGIANSLWGLAQIDLAQEKLDEAAPRVIEAYGIVSHLGRADAIAVIGLLHGQILTAFQMRTEALTVLRRSAEMFRKLGLEKEAHDAEKLISDLGLT